MIYRAVREVTLPVASGIAIIVIVFLPLLTLQGLEGKLFKPVALDDRVRAVGVAGAVAHGDSGARIVSHRQAGP